MRHLYHANENKDKKAPQCHVDVIAIQRGSYGCAFVLD